MMKPLLFSFIIFVYIIEIYANKTSCLKHATDPAVCNLIPLVLSKFRT